MGFKDKAYGLNPLVVFQLQIELQQHKLNWLVTEHLNASRQARSKGKAMLFSMSKQKLNSSYWHIWHIKNHQK
jgi:hypothetical protein